MYATANRPGCNRKNLDHTKRKCFIEHLVAKIWKKHRHHTLANMLRVPVLRGRVAGTSHFVYNHRTYVAGAGDKILSPRQNDLRKNVRVMHEVTNCRSDMAPKMSTATCNCSECRLVTGILHILGIGRSPKHSKHQINEGEALLS